MPAPTITSIAVVDRHRPDSDQRSSERRLCLVAKEQPGSAARISGSAGLVLAVASKSVHFNRKCMQAGGQNRTETTI